MWVPMQKKAQRQIFVLPACTLCKTKRVLCSQPRVKRLGLMRLLFQSSLSLSSGVQSMPNLADASDIMDAILLPSISDPLKLPEEAGLADLKQKIFDEVKEAAHSANEQLNEDWSNLFSCTCACDVLFDLKSIWNGPGTSLCFVYHFLSVLCFL